MSPIVPLLLVACTAEPEITSFEVVLEHTGDAFAYKQSGSFAAPDVTFEVHAGIGDRLSLVTSPTGMADRFFSPDGDGIALYDGRDPITGDVTDQLAAWEIGTDGVVRPATGSPTAAEAVSVSVAHQGDSLFEVTVVDAGGGLSAGVFVIHSGPDPLFADGDPEPGVGLAALVEHGTPSALASALAGDTGITVPLAHPFWVVEQGAGALFEEGRFDFGEGLEALAEDGATTDLADTWIERDDASSWGFVENPDGTYDGSAVLPGQTYTLAVTAAPGDRLHAAWMFAESNDVVIALPPEGFMLFDYLEVPFEGAVTELAYWDVGTEENQRPAFGPDQPARQVAPNSGPNEGGTVHLLDDGFEYPAVEDVVRMTVTPIRGE